LSVIWLPVLILLAQAGPDRALIQSPELLPAYAHNDYRNPRPLVEALERGYRGVEADYFVVNGECLLGHDRGELDPARTLRRVYLEPLRRRVQRYGSVIESDEPFLLNIEAKEDGPLAYEALHRLLAEYEDILTVVRHGVVEPGPVQVVLVGWYPPLDRLAGQPVRYVAVQRHVGERGDADDHRPADLLHLVSLDYTDVTKWNGSGNPPRRLRHALKELVEMRDRVPGRVARVHAAPVNERVYRVLLEAGVDLIGTESLEETQELLRGRTAVHPRVARVQEFQEARYRGDRGRALRFLSGDARIWFGNREGAGRPWALDGPWEAWDRFFHARRTYQGWEVRGDAVTAISTEQSEFYELIDREPWPNRLTWWLDDAGKIDGYLVASLRRGEPRSRFEEFTAWAAVHEPDELAYLMSGGEIDPAGDRPERWKAALLRWRAAADHGR